MGRMWCNIPLKWYSYGISKAQAPQKGDVGYSAGVDATLRVGNMMMLQQ